MNPLTGLLEPEYVNIFGVPFTFLPHEGGQDGPPQPQTPKRALHPETAKEEYAISWQNVVRIDHTYSPRLTLDIQRLEARPLVIDASATARIAELASVVDGKPDLLRISAISLESLARQSRMQRIVFEVARDMLETVGQTWKGSRAALMGQLVHLTERVIHSQAIVIRPREFAVDRLRRQLVLMLNMTAIVQYTGDAIRFDNTERLELIFDRDRPVRRTHDMSVWYTGSSTTEPE